MPTAITAISQACHDKIIEFEIGGPGYYEKFASTPVWPGGNSGITIGVGYDLGQHTCQELTADWGDKLDPAILCRLENVIGLSGSKAQWVLHSVKDIRIPRAAAISVFDERTLPHYIDLTLKAFKGAEALHPDCLGALVDLIYNRGADVTSMTDRRAEMRMIRIAVQLGNVAGVPDFIRSMKRLWPAVKSLQARREWEAATFEHGMSATGTHCTVAAPKVYQQDRPVIDENNVETITSDELNSRELDRVRRINRT